jgi:hypothetical protein
MKDATKINAIPLELAAANEFIANLHRHHGPVYRDKFRVGALVDGKLVGVVQVGRPVSRYLDNGENIEVVRLCTDGTKNVCSFLYAKAARIAKEMGYKKIITYILESESGTSLKAAGWKQETVTNGGTWNRKSRPRNTTAPTVPKKRYVKILQEDE